MLNTPARITSIPMNTIKNPTVISFIGFYLASHYIFCHSRLLINTGIKRSEIGRRHRFPGAEPTGRSTGTQEAIEEINREMEEVGRMIDQYVDSAVYQSAVEKMSSRGHATLGGRGPGKNVAEMTVIRLQHAKRAMGDQAYLSGELIHPHVFSTPLAASMPVAAALTISLDNPAPSPAAKRCFTVVCIFLFTFIRIA